MGKNVKKAISKFKKISKKRDIYSKENNDNKIEKKKEEKEINKYKKLDEDVYYNLRVTLPIVEEIDTTVKVTNKIEKKKG